MGRFAKEPEGGDFTDVEAGNYVGRCYRIIELGTTHDEWQGKPRTRTRLMISFELPDELMEDGRPFSVTWWVTNSLSEKSNLRIGLDLWRKKAFTEEELKGFDLVKILGVPAMVTVERNTKNRANVAGVGSLPKGMTCGPAVNPPQSFFLDEWDDKVWQEIPQGIQDLIRVSDEYRAIQMARMKAAQGTKAPQSDALDDDTIPF